MLIPGKSHSRDESCNSQVSIETFDFARVRIFTCVIRVGSDDRPTLRAVGTFDVCSKATVMSDLSCFLYRGILQREWRIHVGVPSPALLFRCPLLKRTYFENMSLQFLAEQGAS